MENNNQKNKEIYDKVQKKWYVVSNEFYKAYDRLCNTTRKRMQYQGRCECNKSKWWLCDARCLDCEFYISPTESLDAPILSDDGATNATLMDFVSDPRARSEKFVADCDLLEYLCARLKELFAEDTEKVLTIWKDHPEGISDRKVAKAIGYPQRTFANKMKRFRDMYHHLLNN